LASAQAEDTRGLRLGSLTQASAEYVIYTRLSFRARTAYTNYGRCAINGITYVVGNKQSQVTVGGTSATNHANLSNLNFDDSGHISTGDYLAAFDSSGAAQAIPKATFSLSGHNHTWSSITSKPSWLSGTTLSQFQTGHTHSQYLTGFTVTPAMVTGITDTLYLHADTPLFTGNTFVASGACEILVAGDVVTIYAPSGGTSAGASIVQITASTYTIASTDSGNILEFTNTGSTTISLPTGLTTNFQLTIVNYGNGTSSGVKTIAAGTGATVKSALSALKLSTIFGAATAYYRGSNVWVVFGDLTA